MITTLLFSVCIAWLWDVLARRRIRSSVVDDLAWFGARASMLASVLQELLLG